MNKTNTNTLTDIDGNVYKTVKIGQQIWMAENLNVKHFRNGDPIPEVKVENNWENAIGPACCFYENDPEIGEKYGRLYNWKAVNDPRGLAPASWHVPTDEEWKELERYIGMSTSDLDKATPNRGHEEGGKLKETGTTHWESPNTGATNESGFTALPGGYRFSRGTFNQIGRSACFWSFTEGGSFGVWFRSIDHNYSTISRMSSHWTDGFSVRLVRD